MALVLVLIISALGIGIGSLGIIGLRRWAKDPTMPKRLPGFNIFTGKWSDEAMNRPGFRDCWGL